MLSAPGVEPLRAANRLSGETLFAWRLFSHDGDPVRASNGIDIAVGGSIGEDAALDLLLVCARTPDARAACKPLAQWLRGLVRGGAAIGGISLGAYPLA